MKIIDKFIGNFFLFLLKFLMPILKNNKTNQTESPKRILLINLVAMGDLIMMGPLTNSLKKSFPDTEIDLLTTKRTAVIVENQNIYHKIYYLNFNFKFFISFFSLVRMLKKNHYNIIFETEFYYNITTILSVLLSPETLVGFKLQKSRYSFFNKAINFYDNTNIAINYLNLGDAIDNYKKTEKLIPLIYNNKDVIHVNSLLRSINNPILIHVGTSRQAISRRLPSKTWKEVIEALQIKHNIVLVGGTEEESILKEISPKLTSNTTNLIGKLSITQLAYLCTLTKLYIGLDTGPTHLATSMGTKILAIYGPNTPALWGPYTDNVKILYSNLTCSPCTRQHQGIVSKCKNNLCMQNISSKDIISKIDF